MDLSEGVPSMDQVQQQQQAKAAYEEQKANILDQILEPGTKDRIKRLAIVNPDMATRIQDSLIQAATSGQLRNKVSWFVLLTVCYGMLPPSVVDI